MTKRASMRPILVTLGLLAVAGMWLLRGSGDDAPDDTEELRGKDPALLLDRVWIDSKPEKYTDYAHVMLVLRDAPIGIFQKASSYQATVELFEHTRRESVLAVHFPQSGSRRQTKYRIRECSDLPPFDLCLELGKNPWGGPRRYYGMTDPDEERAELGALRHELEHRLASANGGAR